jgi:hypothetical protein
MSAASVDIAFIGAVYFKRPSAACSAAISLSEAAMMP